MPEAFWATEKAPEAVRPERSPRVFFPGGEMSQVTRQRTTPKKSVSGFRFLVPLAAFVLALLGTALSAEAEIRNNVILVEDDGDIIEPAAPVPFGGHRVVFAPAGGGYTTRIDAGVVPTALGARLALAADETAPVPIRLMRPVVVFGRSYQDLFVHPHGAVSFGQTFPEGVAAFATDPADMLSGLLSGPPLVSVLWNELQPLEASAPGAGIYFAELPDRVVVTWARLSSIRPAGQPNTFRMVLHRTGRIELEYPLLATGWGIVGVSPGAGRVATDIVDLATEPEVLPDRALFSWYRDRPRLNEVALARRVYAEAPDQFDFLAVFTDQVVDGPHLVGSVTVSNGVTGIGMPLFDHSAAFGSRNLEHMVLMNSLSFYDDDPTRPPRIPHYAYAPSTLAVLGHEMGHRWLAHAGEPLVAAGRRGHWNFFLDTDGSFMGGSRLMDNADGTFTTEEVMTRFGALDQYLMGIRAPDEVDDFFVVERPWGVDATAATAPEAGMTFGGERRDLSVADVIDRLGERAPAGDGRAIFRMGFVLVVGQGKAPSAAAVSKVQRIRRGFTPYFRAATDGRAHVRTWLPRGGSPEPVANMPPLPRNPFILGFEIHTTDEGVLVAQIDFLDLGGDLLALDLTTDASSSLPPARIDLAAAAYGNRRGTVSFALRRIPPGATEIHVSLLDSTGLRSFVYAQPLPEELSAT